MNAEVVRGSDNVFSDLGFDNPDEELLKAQLALRIRRLVNDRSLTEPKTAALLGVTQPDVCALVDGRISGFSLEQLFGFIRRLGDDVEIIVRRADAAERTGRMRLRVA